MSTTVVSAFYPLSKSKHSLAKYLEWIKQFCRIPCNLVVFTDVGAASAIREARGSLSLHLIERPFESFEMTSPAMMKFWNHHHVIDVEKSIHSPELYAVWAMKQELIRLVIAENPFHSTWFVWCDIGIHREPSLHSFYESFPSKTSEVCPPGRICFLEVERISDSFVADWSAAAPMKYPVPWTTLGGGCIAGDATAWNEFGTAYVEMLREFDRNGWFAGKDQVIYFAILMNRRTQKPFRLFHAKSFASVSGIHWMSFPAILGGTVSAEIDMRFEEKKSDCYVQLIGGLCNQLFQVAAGYAHCKRNGLQLRISKSVQFKPAYWGSWLHRFIENANAPLNLSPVWQEHCFHYEPIPESARYLHGFFQSAKFFADVSGEIRNLFCPPESVQTEIQKKYSALLTPENLDRAIIVHVRRGDYLMGGNLAKHGILTEKYYEAAVSAMRALNPDGPLLVFSDDLPWCRAQPYFAGATFVDEPHDVKALWIMSRFRHYIMSNSTFSWWAVWLGASWGHVIAPDRWFGSTGPQDWQDVYEPDWIRVQAE
jgi:hypothetical protein